MFQSVGVGSVLRPLRRLQRVTQEQWLLHSYRGKSGRKSGHALPRIAFVKQSTQSDLYCAAADASPAEIVLSTLMRTGPAALFLDCGARLIIVEPCADEECRVWRQPAEELGWYTIAELEALRHKVPGRNCGQSVFAVAVEDVCWNDFDVVVSLDVSVPERITREFPNVVWCYYVREPKSSAWRYSLDRPLPGQDLFLNQGFSLSRRASLPHQIEFPYYFQFCGCFEELIGGTDRGREGVFLEHLSVLNFSHEHLERLSAYGTIASTAEVVNRTAIRVGSAIERLTVLHRTKYFVHVGGSRRVWGNAMIEAIACGCLALVNPDMHAHTSLISPGTTVRSPMEAIERLRFFERHPAEYARELSRQQRLLDVLCYLRPLEDLILAVERVRSRGRRGGLN